MAIEQGAVWWGKYGSGISYKRLDSVRQQLESHIETRVYLFARGECWRTTLVDITTDEKRVDIVRKPPYYSTSLCRMFVLLRDFVALSPEWAEYHLVPEAHPEPARMSGALANRRASSTFLNAIRRAQSDSRPRRSSELLGISAFPLDLGEPRAVLVATAVRAKAPASGLNVTRSVPTVRAALLPRFENRRENQTRPKRWNLLSLGVIGWPLRSSH